MKKITDVVWELAEPVRFEKNEVALVRLRVEF